MRDLADVEQNVSQHGLHKHKEIRIKRKIHAKKVKTAEKRCFSLSCWKVKQRTLTTDEEIEECETDGLGDYRPSCCVVVVFFLFIRQQSFTLR